jgi:methylglutaconyl-CoA hydratase
MRDLARPRLRDATRGPGYHRAMTDHLTTERLGPLLLLTLNDPRRANPLSAQLAQALKDALLKAADARSVRAVILAGAGRHFSAGADLAALERIAEGGDLEANLADSRVLEELYGTLLSHPKLTVAAVSGAAVAGGCGLATACDFVVAERGARFCYTEVKIGFVPALVLTFLTRRVPGHLARRLVLDPEMLDGEAAARLGLADELVDDGMALERAKALALGIARKASPAAIAATKKLMNDTVGMGWRDALNLAAEANARQRLHPECQRGVRTFLETKTTPDWLDSAITREHKA